MNHEISGSVPGLDHWVKDLAMSCCVGCRRSSDPTLLWLWCRPAATAPIRPLAWDPPYAEGVALKRKKAKKKKKIFWISYTNPKEIQIQTEFKRYKNFRQRKFPFMGWMTHVHLQFSQKLSNCPSLKGSLRLWICSRAQESSLPACLLFASVVLNQRWFFWVT